MALETERCSPSNASSPGPTDNNRRPGLEDCSDQTKEVQSPGSRSRIETPSPPFPVVGNNDVVDNGGPRPPPPLPTNPSPTFATVLAFRPERKDAVTATDTRTPVDAGVQSMPLACSKPLSICSPLQNKTAVADKRQIAQPLSTTTVVPVQKPSPVTTRKKSLSHIQKPNLLAPSVDLMPRWIQQQQQHAVQNSDSMSDHVQPLTPPQTATAAVEYAMVAAAAAAAAAGHVPPVFPFNSWMYRFNFLPLVPAAAAECFREIQHHHQNGGGLAEIAADSGHPPMPHHLLPFHNHQQIDFTRQQLPDAVPTVHTYPTHSLAGGHVVPLIAPTATHRMAAATATLQPPLTVPPPLPTISRRSQQPPPSRPPPASFTTPTQFGGYVSRPTSTSGSSDVSSSCGGGGRATSTSVTVGAMSMKNFCRSPSPRSPSPIQLAFSVDNILRPEFGNKLHYLHHHHHVQDQRDQHRHHLNNGDSGRPSSTSPPSPFTTAAAASKLHYSVADKTNLQLQKPLQTSSSLQPTQSSSLLRPFPTRPNASTAAKRLAAQTANKVKRKPASSALLPTTNANKSIVNGDDVDHRLKSDDSATGIRVNRGVDNDNDDEDGQESDTTTGNDQQAGNDKEMWPAWVYCTRYSDRPSSGKSTFIVLYRFTSRYYITEYNT